MRRTVIDIPVLRDLLRGIGWTYLKLFGFRIEGRPPDLPKCVIIGAHHTSNWDFPLAMAVSFALSYKIFWLGKEAVFRWPFVSFFQWMGGIPIDRSRAGNVTAQTIEAFAQSERMALALAPEGTRKRTTAWKRGFYFIAEGAKVPIQLAGLDYGRKTVVFGPLLYPSGDIEADMRIIRDFYANVTPKHPEKAGPVTVFPHAGG